MSLVTNRLRGICMKLESLELAIRETKEYILETVRSLEAYEKHIKLQNKEIRNE